MNLYFYRYFIIIPYYTQNVSCPNEEDILWEYNKIQVRFDKVDLFVISRLY